MISAGNGVTGKVVPAAVGLTNTSAAVGAATGADGVDGSATHNRAAAHHRDAAKDTAIAAGDVGIIETSVSRLPDAAQLKVPGFLQERPAFLDHVRKKLETTDPKAAPRLMEYYP